jgi:hypothetical protein
MTDEHADKRTVNTDALETLGTIIGPYEKRDAIHLAVDPAVAVEVLQPGQDVGFVVGGVGVTDNPVGIVDPFLKAPVQVGEQFWLVVYPRQITSLRHVWSHPSFEDEEDEVIETDDFTAERAEFVKELDGTNASRRWIENYADSVGLGNGEIMEAAGEWITSQEDGNWGEYLNRGELLDGVQLDNEFWTHYEKVTGVVLKEDDKQNFFTCSC